MTWIIAVMQWIILAVVLANCWGAFRVGRMNRATLNAIKGYHSEIAWLTARLDELEKRLGSNGQKGVRG